MSIQLKTHTLNTESEQATHSESINTKKTNSVDIIENIINNLDSLDDKLNIRNDTINSEKEFITKSEFSSYVETMKNDVLSLVNLLDTLNKSVTKCNDDIRNIKRDIRGLHLHNLHNLPDDNKQTSHLKTTNPKFSVIDQRSSITDQRSSITDQKSSITDQRSSITDQKTANPEEQKPTSGVRLIKRVNYHDNSKENTNVSIDTSNTNIRVVKNNNGYDNDDDTNTNTNTNTNTDTDTDTDSNADNVSVNSFVDSQMDKRAKKVKTAPPRSKNSSKDVYGVPEEKNLEVLVLRGNFRQTARQEIIESTQKVHTDTSTTRATRLNLQKRCNADKTTCNKSEM